MKTIEETYRARLQMLVDEAGSQSALAKKIDKSPAQISQWINASKDSRSGKPRAMDRETARQIERACAATVTTEGAKVRQIQVAGATECKFLGIAEVTGNLVYSSMTEGRRDMLAQLRNRVADMGGNAFVPTALDVSYGFSLPLAQGDAYHCP